VDHLGKLTTELTSRLDGLLGEIGKLGREQFRATTLLEGQGAGLEELAEAWRHDLDQRDREAAELRQALAQLEGQARLRLAQELLPVADAVDASVRAARELRAGLQARPRGRPGWLRRWFGARGRLAADAEWDAALDAWLEGLLLVERRLLAVLELENVRPMSALGQAFDPHRHLAVAVTHDSRAPDGTVVAEERRGYTVGDRVLRHAEVVVARGRGDGPRARPADGQEGSGDDAYRRD
jgi:molecular chaperone GrpE (heat shock protein)